MNSIFCFAFILLEVIVRMNGVNGVNVRVVSFTYNLNSYNFRNNWPVIRALAAAGDDIGFAPLLPILCIEALPPPPPPLTFSRRAA